MVSSESLDDLASNLKIRAAVAVVNLSTQIIEWWTADFESVLVAIHGSVGQVVSLARCKRVA